MMRKQFYNVAAVLLVAIFTLQCLASLRHMGDTSDEHIHIAAGYSYWTTGKFEVNPEHPPLVKLLAAVPLLFMDVHLPQAERFWHRDMPAYWQEVLFYENNEDKMMFWARLPMIGLSAALAIILYGWSKELFGPAGGLFSLFLYCFCPNIIAHGRLVTTDLALALFGFWAVRRFWKFATSPSHKNLFLAGIGFGLAQAAKFSAIVFYPIVGVLAAGTALVPGEIEKWNPWPRRSALGSQQNEVARSPWLKRIINSAISIVVILYLGFLVVLAFYFFVRFDRYVVGLDDVLRHSSKGHPAFLMGMYSTQGWPYYFPLAFLMKTPIPVLVFVVLAVLLWPRTWRGWITELCIVLPPAALFAASVFNHMNIGVRHILPVYPFIYLFCGRFAAGLVEQKSPYIRVPLRALAAALGCWYVFGTLSVYPEYISYFNEAVGGPQNGYHYLSDSNVDWGQDDNRLAEYCRDLEAQMGPGKKLRLYYLGFYHRPDLAFRGVKYEMAPPNEPGPFRDELAVMDPDVELLAISTIHMEGTYFTNRVMYKWLEQFTPKHKIGYSTYVYDITNNLLAHRMLAGSLDRNSRWLEAAAQRRMVLRLDPADSVQRFQYAKNLVYIGDLDEARNQYALLHEKEPEWNLADMIRDVSAGTDADMAWKEVALRLVNEGLPAIQSE